jgi:malate dehydrogenase (oxaloacetate-decarboxylating)
MEDCLLDEDNTGFRISSAQRKYCKSRNGIKNWTLENKQQPPRLLKVTDMIKPTILVGVSTCAGAFTENIIRSMAANCERPIIFPLSNPTRIAEATPHDLIYWVRKKNYGQWSEMMNRKK